MANFPSYRHDATGKTLYVTFTNAAGQYWDTTGTPAYETLVPASWANYDTAATETPASSYQYIVAIPATLTANAYVYLTYYERATGSVLITDPVVATALYWWDGTAAREVPVNTGGSGDVTWVYTVYAGPGETNGIENANVTVTSDAAGDNAIAGPLQTDSDGEVTFYLPAGTYYFWTQATGYTFTQPDTEVVA